MSSVYPPFGSSSARRCLRCGAPMPDNVVTCLNCGTYNPVIQPVASTDQSQFPWRTAQPQASINGTQYSGAQLGEPYPSPMQYPQWSQSTSSPQQNLYRSRNLTQSPPSSNSFYPTPGQYQQNNSNGYYMPSQQLANNFYPSTTYDVYAQPPSQKKKGSGIGFMIGIGLLIMLLVGGGFAGYYYYVHYVQKNTSTSTTSTVVTTPAVKPLFSDAFTSNTMGWDLTSSPGNFFVKVGAGSLTLEDDRNKLLWEVVPSQNFSDFRLDVNAALTKGDPNNGYGVFIRAANQGGDLGTYYRFELYGDGSYAIFKGYVDASGTPQSTIVQGYVVNSAIAKVGHVNHLTLIAKGSSMTLIVNGQSIYTYIDNNYKGGKIALFVSNLPKLASGAQAVFTNLAIFPATN